MNKKSWTIGIIFIFIGVALAPSINSSVVKDELVEFDVELCGLGRKHTVKLTQQEADEVERLFDDMQDRLSAVKSDDEAVVIFNEAVVELDKYGLLSGLSVKEAQRLITFQYQNLRDNKFLQKIVNAEKLDENENRNCIVTGNLNEMVTFQRPILKNLRDESLIQYVIYLLSRFPYDIPITLMDMFRISITPSILMDITFGEHRWDNWPLFYPTYNINLSVRDMNLPSQGVVWSDGLNGIVEWNGSLYGHLGSFTISSINGFYRRFFVGVTGFTGIKLLFQPDEGFHKTYFICSALKVKLDYA